MKPTILATLTLAAGLASASAASIYLGDTRNAGTPPSGVTNPSDQGGVDGWNSNMIIQNGQSYTVNSADISGGNALVATEFNFMVGNNRGRVTPFIVEVLSQTSFNVLAIGDTRISGVDYNANGIQNVAFSAGGAFDLSGLVSDGMVIAAGFINSDPDGTNTVGSVIPFTNNSVPAGEQWYNGNSAVDTYPAGVLTDGSFSADSAANVTVRAYDFNVGLDVIPEPSTGLLGLVGLGLLAARRRR
ncbi:MAG: PEP-CTERM sorting domain-containing protein [Verrucomicrobiales bacterium]